MKLAGPPASVDAQRAGVERTERLRNQWTTVR